MTHPTKAICPILLEDYRKITVERKGETNFFTSQMIKDCMKKVICVNLHETVKVDDELEIKAYYAGHVLGAAMFHVKVGSQSVVYTGDYNMTPDRHLGSAWIDKCRPDLLITESTYATTIRDSKRCRERDFLLKVHDCVDRGGKVLIPVFALGRAQELCILLETYWERMNLKAPIYFAVGLTEKATNYYKMFITWTNQKIKSIFVERNMFDFKHIKPFDRNYIDNPGPMVVFATPGMIHAGLSLQIFKKWAPDERNMVIMPGYCVAGTIGHKILGGARKLELDNKQTLEVRMSVEYMSFSAHADAKGIMQLINTSQPSNVMLVHGEAAKMEFLKGKIEKEFKIPCFMPANGETISISTDMSIPIDVSVDLLKRTLADNSEGDCSDSKRSKLIHGTLIMDAKDGSDQPRMRLIEPEKAISELALKPHTIRFTSTVKIPDSTKETVFQRLQSKLNDSKYPVSQTIDGSIVTQSVVVRVDPTSEDGFKDVYVTWNDKDDALGCFVVNSLQDFQKM
jgi:integrator complex subunit 11